MHWYLHVDLDAFFASVEQLDNPDLRGKPVIVGGLPQDRRSVVSTASYEARKFGVHSAMPTFQAYKLCPQGIFVRGRMQRYAELSYRIMNIFRDYSPDVDQMSIDEAFIDLTGTEKLFGPPTETAMEIKKRVKAETGLTVSMGLASTKYLAKIASGLFKPDGFCHIKHGDEENFMLKLPLNKVWGLGPKSLDLIRSKGLSSTRDIYERDYDSLEFLFGKNMADFLYNVVRGIEKTSFTREAKSHSISAETTFPYDLTDIYMIETELLELAHGVFFRLLKEESFSRTAFVKIRYDDFSTCSIQETCERNIITLDSFFEIIKRLFEKRYQNGRGIRLLGVGFENIVKEEKPYQQDLFSNNDEKKQAVEKAILKLSKKHPEIKVQKARTLKVILFALLLSFAGIKAEAQDLSSGDSLQHEKPASLFDYDINDKNHVDFTASGFWQAEFSTGLDMTFGNDTKTAFAPQLPLFKQEVELSTLITLNDLWYFQADFADEFTKNTFAFGYNSNNLIRSFRLANRGLTMSRGYSAEYFGQGLLGGNNQAPGASLLLKPQNERWQADFLVRYDMTEVKSATFYGMNKASDAAISPADFLYGREFIFPQDCEEELSQIDGLYIESTGGQWKDSRGKSYRRLTKDEYAALTVMRRLYISAEAGGGKNAKGQVPAILLTFNSNQFVSDIIEKTGDYDDATSFLGKIKNELSAADTSQLQGSLEKLETSIDGQAALIIQDNTGFSPFLCMALYNTGKDEADVFVEAGKSGNRVKKYKALSSQDFYTTLYEDFFNQKESFTRLVNSEVEDSNYPFAEDCPEIYLGHESKSGLEIHSRSYTPIKEILIPKTAVSGSLQVYKNGLLLTGVSFDENTGKVELNTSISPTDKIIVTWQEEKNDFSDGALALGAGFKIKLLPFWNADIALTARQSLNQKDEYSYSENQKNSFTALSAGTEFEKNGFKLSEKMNFSLLDENTSKGLLLYSWDEIWDSYQQNSEENQAPEKSAVIRFTPADFSSYKKINIEVDFSDFEEDITYPIILILDEDSGTKAKGASALLVKIYESEALNKALADKKKRLKLSVSPDRKEVFLEDSLLPADEYELKINSAIIPSRLTIEDAAQNEKLFVSELNYEDAKPFVSMRNFNSLEYTNQGAILSLAGFDIIKDLQLYSEVMQGSGDLSSPEYFINSKSKAGVNLAKIILSGELSSQNEDISAASHSLKTEGNLFDIFYAEDSFRKDYFINEEYKLNSFSLNLNKLKLPLQLAFNTNAGLSPHLEKQDLTASLDYRQSIFASEITLGTKLAASQKNIIQSKEKDSSYIEGWKDSTELAFSHGKEEASSRNTNYSAFLAANIPLKNKDFIMKPGLTYELSDSYTDSKPSLIFTDKENLKLQLPFNGKKNSFSFDIARTGGGSKTKSRGGTYLTDTQELFALQEERSYFYTQLPFYDLFKQSLASDLPINSSYSTKYEANFRRSLYNSLKDLYIPSAFTFAVNREVKANLPVSDTYQFKTVITNNSINNFGSSSINKNFNWFRQEELTTSLTTILKLSAADLQNYRLKIQAFSQLLLYITDEANLTEAFDFAIENAGDWNLRDTVSYNRPSKTSLLAELMLHKKEYKISRKDSFTFEIGQIEKNLRQKYDYNHTVTVNFMEYYSIFMALDGSLMLNQKKADQLNLSLRLGAKAEF